MYVSPEVCFAVGTGVGVLLTLVAIIGIALYIDSKGGKK